MRVARVLSAAVVTAAFALPAFAQTTTWYVVQNPSTKHCTVTEQRPVGSESVVVSPDGMVYHTRTEAEGAMKTIKVCTQD